MHQKAPSRVPVELWKHVILINCWQVTFINISVNKENYISVDSRRIFLQDRTTFIMQKRQA